MFTKPSPRCLAQLLTVAAAALIPCVVTIETPVSGPESPADCGLPRAPGSAVDLASNPRGTKDREARTVALDPMLCRVGADESWWQAVSARLASHEYAASPTPQGLRAPNRAHNLSTSFRENGIEVVPRTGERASPAWSFVWETLRFGRTGHMQPVRPASPKSEATRITYRRDGWSEWYENTASGLEQGFTIERRPAGKGPFQIAGALTSALRPQAHTDGSFDFVDGQSVCALRYGGLRAWDTKGVELTSHLEVAATGITIVVDDRVKPIPS